MMKLHLEDINIEVISIAGFYTCIQLPDFKITFDMGICPRSSVNKPFVFFTHAHADHIAGVVRHCASREMLRLSPPTYIIGKEDVDHLRDFLASARTLCRSGMPHKILPFSPGNSIDVRKDLRVRSYRSIHRVPCQGYMVLQVKQKLRSDLKECGREELIARRNKGEILTEDLETPLVSYTGDTTIDVFHKEPRLQELKVLITEVTFLDDKVSHQEAKRRGHLHLDDIVQNAHLFCQPAVVLMHFSSRYSTKHIQRLCQQKLPNDLYQRVHIVSNDEPILTL